MNQIRKNILQKGNSIIAGFLGLLGFTTSCDWISGGMVAEYGTPCADFIVKGTVRSQTTSQPIPQIKVKAGWDSVYTDQNGKYQVIYDGFPQSQDVLVHFTDVDGASNGNFQPLDTMIKFENPIFKGGNGHWYEGKVEKTVDIVLKP
jgi:putative lipoprotein (rSAM/lipoprotein system)